MRVLFVVSGLALADGGTTESITRMAEAVARPGADVTIAYGSREGDRGETAAAEGGRFRLVPLRSTGPAGWGHEIRPGLRSLVGESDLVHLHGLWHWPLVVARLEARRAGRPAVISTHGALAEWPMDHHGFRKRLALALWERRQIGWAAALIATGDHERRETSALLPSARIEVVPHGIHVPSEAGIAREGGPYRVGFLGRVHQVKAVERLAAAVSLLRREFPEISLEIGGPADHGARTWVESAAGADAGSFLRWRGLLQGEEKWAFLRECGVVALTSHFENFGLAAGEALAIGRPIVAGRSTAWSFVEEAGLGAVVEPTVESISAGLRRVLSNPSIARRAREEGPGLVRDHFNWESAGKCLLSIYESVLAGGSRTREKG